MNPRATAVFIPTILLLLFVTEAYAQQSELTVAKIMQDPDTWIGAWPSQPSWSEDGRTVYFWWNPKGEFESDSLFKTGRAGASPVKVDPEERRSPRPIFSGWHHGEHVYDANWTRKVYGSDGDIFLHDITTGSTTQLTETRTRESNPRFSLDGHAIFYIDSNNIFKRYLATGRVEQVSDIRSGNKPEEKKADEQDQYLVDQQLELFDYVRQEAREDSLREAAQEREEVATGKLLTWYIGKKNVQQLQVDPAERFISFVLSDPSDREKRTAGFNYVTEDGYAEELSARAKVGVKSSQATLMVQDLVRDTTYAIDLHQLPGAYDVPAYQREQGVEVDSSTTKRVLHPTGPFWSGDGQFAVLDIRSADHKERWIVRLDPVSGDLEVLDRQYDEAWVGGPGISWYGGRSDVGWLDDNRTFYFKSEATGYSHLYTVDVSTGKKTQLTTGNHEVFNPMLSKDGKHWYFTSSEESPHVRHYYRMRADGSRVEKLTTMEGNNAAALDPTETILALGQSVSTRPPEVFVQEIGEGPVRVTQSATDEWLSYDWRKPETIHIPASDGVQVPAHIFQPDNPNGAAVLFVHGAGYLQNVHDWWSSYFREYMFHNLLADLGYTVVQLDYRASAGYGRDWRTAIYRYMGGRDLQDYVDASKYLTAEHGIDPERIAIYGGSYGGFITLMALFNEPEYFGAGAALRSVTDWAHYNHVYTSRILNTPVTDSLAYAQSSPINFAAGLEDPLLMAHGIIDLNVQFQDIIRLSQKLIELGKEDWELAVYPVEGHGFTEPASWTDEYRRILELIEENVGPERDN